jgi:uncharacterized YccA/Bax inhibitor family protein
MKIIVGKATTIVFLMSLAIFGTAQAAYIDPNTGGAIFQILAVLIGVISGMLLLFSSQVKKVFYRIKRSVRGEKSELSDESQPDDQD